MLTALLLPPPPRYPSGQYGLGMPGQAVIETNNVLSKPTGPEYQLIVGEGSVPPHKQATQSLTALGTYVLRDSLHLATPPPHPSEAPVHNPNPLATTPSPPTTGTKLSVTVLTPRSSPRLHRSGTINSTRSGMPPSIQESPQESQSAGSDFSLPYNKNNGFGYQATPTFGEGNPALGASNGKEAKDPLKRRKPKNNIIKSNSSFVSRVIPHENVAKRLQERNADGLLAFANVNRALQWLDLSAPNKVGRQVVGFVAYADCWQEEHLTKILFTKAHALCHDVNLVTKTNNHLDIVMGFSTGDIIWYEPMSQKYARLNKNGVINKSAVSEIRWLPNSDSLFLAAHMDGTLIVYDKEKEDAPFVPEDTGSVSDKSPSDNGRSRYLQIRKSIQSRNQKNNPLSVWKVSNSKINAFAFSPDNRHLAVVSEDGTLRIIDYLQEQLLDVFSSYYGGLMCVCWSPDGRYVVTGGQDDLVSIWSLEDSMLVARCQGHNSWVTGVAFDPWRCDDRNYRFGSVGEDCRLLLWDFSVGMLHRPRAASVQQRGSISSHLPPARTRADSSTSRLRSDSNLTSGSAEGELTVHPVEPRARTAMLPPVLAKSVDDHPLRWLAFEEDCILTSCDNGHIRTWDRPKEGAEGAQGSESAPSLTGSSSL